MAILAITGDVDATYSHATSSRGISACARAAAPRGRRGWPRRSWPSPGRCGLRRCVQTASGAGQWPRLVNPSPSQHHDLAFAIGQRQPLGWPDEAREWWRRRTVRRALLPASSIPMPIHVVPGGDTPTPRARPRRRPQRGRPCARIPQTPRPIQRRRQRAGQRRTGPQGRHEAPRRSLPARANEARSNGHRTAWRSANTSPPQRIADWLRRFRPPTTTVLMASLMAPWQAVTHALAVSCSGSRHRQLGWRCFSSAASAAAACSVQPRMASAIVCEIW